MSSSPEDTIVPAVAPIADLQPAAGEAWCVCHTKPRCEKKFAALLAAERMAHYLPLVDSVKHYERHTRRHTKPLFTGYVFARVPEGRRNRLYQQDLIVRVIPAEHEALLLRQLRDVQRILASGFELNLHPPLRKGDLVKVAGGPLHGLEGRVDDPTNPQGIVISVDVLQQGLLVKIPVAHLEPLNV